MLSNNTRIGIIGAGAAGLSAALALRKKGYKNITVLEKEAIAGGKCHTIYYQGRNYELGASVIARSQKNIYDIINKLGLKTALINQVIASFNSNGEKIDIIYKSDLIKFLWQVFVQIPYLYLKYIKIYKPGFNNINSELAQPLMSFVNIIYRYYYNIA